MALFFISVLVTLNVGLTVLTLAAVSRLREKHEDVRTHLVDGFNTFLIQLTDIDTKVANAMDCLVTADARLSNSSESEEHAA